MKRSLRKLGVGKHERERTNVLPLSQLEEVAQATQDMQDMRDCYDTLLSAAAATANSAYEFSESLGELGSCLLEKTALNDDEESGKALLMLGKMQFQLQKLIDNYRSHINQTIVIPSNSLLNELRIVEEMKQQCDEKREAYEYMLTKYRERSRSRSRKEESFSLQQLQTACDEYDEEATLYVFRLKSLKQVQSWSLLTQAARHHAAQMCFFKKAVKSLETVEPHVKSVTEQRHIDYHFIGLEGEDEDEDDDDDDVDHDNNSYDENDGGELSFNYRQNEHKRDVSESQNSMKENLGRLHRNSFSFRARSVSQSAPLFAGNTPDSGEKMRKMQPSLSRKFNSYVLPTPVDAKISSSSRSSSQVPSNTKTNLNESAKNLWHSSPLEQKKYENVLGDEGFSGPNIRNSESILKESNSNTAFTRLPPLIDGISSSNRDFVASYSKKIKRHAFSGPLASNWPTKPVSVASVQLFSGPLLRTPVPLPPSPSPKVSPGASPTFASSPKVSELHELPRPPTSSSSNSRHFGLVGHSGPLVSKGPKLSDNSVASNATSPLPMPPQAIARSFSIPSSGAKVSTIYEDIASPPLTPIALPSSQLLSYGSETAARAV